jgi:hypothetical protein
MLEEIIAKASSYFNYVFRVLSEKYRVEIHWEISTRPNVDSRVIGGEEKITREIYELRIYIVGKGTTRVNGITRYYIEIEKFKRREYLGFRLASFEEIEDEIRRFL